MEAGACLPMPTSHLGELIGALYTFAGNGRTVMSSLLMIVVYVGLQVALFHQTRTRESQCVSLNMLRIGLWCQVSNRNIVFVECESSIDR